MRLGSFFVIASHFKVKVTNIKILGPQGVWYNIRGKKTGYYNSQYIRI